MKAAEQVIGTARASACAQIDRALVANAVAIPWLFGKQPNIEAQNVHGINDLWNAGAWDYAYTSINH
jgi:hypothetical protein